MDKIWEEQKLEKPKKRNFQYQKMSKKRKNNTKISFNLSNFDEIELEHS